MDCDRIVFVDMLVFAGYCFYVPGFSVMSVTAGDVGSSLLSPASSVARI